MIAPRSPEQEESFPSVSVILPVHNEQASIHACLSAVLEQNYLSERMEVIVADGMSTDRTREIVQSLQKEHANLRCIENPGRIVSTGLNAAIRMSKGHVVVRVDGHSIIAPDYVRACVAELYRSGADNVGGKMFATGGNRFGKVVALATSTSFGVGGARFHYSEQEEWVDTVYLGAWRREVFAQVGLFDEELVRDQDDEFNYRLREHQGKILLSPHLRSTYTVRGNPRSLWRQYFQYGFWKIRVMQKHPYQMRPRQFVPPLFVASLIGSAVLAQFVVAGQVLLACLSGAYLAANLAASLVVARRHGWRPLLLLPIVFANLHLSYGLGFLLGLLKFWNRWGDKVGKVPKWAGRSGTFMNSPD
jgi:glycosyltransferase involved in cell wall biosynthesis